MPIRYTPGQMREALGLTKETFRYWKRDLPALSREHDQRARFGPSDLVATAIVKTITESAGVPVRRLVPIADDLFALCRANAWQQLERATAVFLLDKNEVLFVPNGTELPSADIALVLPLQPIVGALREQLNDINSDEQPSLAFPPFALSQGADR